MMMCGRGAAHGTRSRTPEKTMGKEIYGEKKSLRQPLPRANELELGTSLRRVGESSVFLYSPPFLGDHPKCFISIPGDRGFNKPTTDDHTLKEYNMVRD